MHIQELLHWSVTHDLFIIFAESRFVLVIYHFGTNNREGSRKIILSMKHKDLLIDPYNFGLISVEGPSWS
jgi:hypothetical protein